MRQSVLLGAARRRQKTEVLGVVKTLLERVLGDREQEEEHQTKAQSLNDAIDNDRRLPETPK